MADDASEADASMETAKLIESADETLRVLDERDPLPPRPSVPHHDRGLAPAIIVVICVVLLGCVGAVVALIINRRGGATSGKSEQAVEQAQRDTEFKSLRVARCIV